MNELDLIYLFVFLESNQWRFENENPKGYSIWDIIYLSCLLIKVKFKIIFQNYFGAKLDDILQLEQELNNSSEPKNLIKYFLAKNGGIKFNSKQINEKFNFLNSVRIFF